jgi:hypothetical protein
LNMISFQLWEIIARLATAPRINPASTDRKSHCCAAACCHFRAQQRTNAQPRPASRAETR